MGSISSGHSSKRGVFPLDEPHQDLPCADKIWDDNLDRFCRRARASGALNAETLWNEAIGQVKKGWLDAPQPLNDQGVLTTYPSDPVIIDFSLRRKADG